MNVNGLLNNFNELNLLIKSLNFEFIVLTETHITDQIEEGEYQIENYNVVTCFSHSRHTGGVVIYIKKNIQYSIINVVEMQFLWIMSIKIFVDNTEWSITGLYRSPSPQYATATFINVFGEWCKEFIEKERNCIIAGDFNIDLLRNESVQMKNKISDECLKQIIREPTRITNMSKTLIDYLLVKNYCQNVTYKIEHCHKISDHETVLINVNIKKNLKKCRKIIKIFKYEKNSFCLNLIEQLVVNSNLLSDVHQKAYCFQQSILNCINLLSININVVNNNSMPGWFTQELDRLKRLKIRSYMSAVYSNGNQACWDEYVNINNFYKQEIIKVKNNFVKDKIKACGKDQRSLWKNIKQFVLNAKKDNELNEIIFNNELIQNSLQIANTMNDFFIQSIEDISNSVPKVQYVNMIDTVNSRFNFELVTDAGLKTLLRNLKNKRDFNGVNIKMLVDAYDIIGPYLLNIINCSMMSGTFPESWKESVVIPIPKVKNSRKCEDLRPINMLPIHEKVLEKCVCIQLENYLEQNNILIPEQSGFRKGHSCETALTWITFEWKQQIDTGHIVVAVFLDFKRAFETVDRVILLNKLTQYGVLEKEINWFKSYLNQRSQRVRVNGNIMSSPRAVDIGIPQGSVLGVLLFLIYINDIGTVLNVAKVALFADDCLVYIAGKNYDEIVYHLNEDLKNLYKWINMNKLKLNVNKTKCMIFNSRIDPLIKINEESIEVVKNFKYLGVIIDNKLKFDEHLNKVCAKIAKKIGFLKRLRYSITKETAILLYNALILPHFDYSATIIFGANTEFMYRLQVLQNKGMRTILKYDLYTPSRVMITELKWMYVKQRVIFKVVIFIFKMKYSLLPMYLSRNLNYVSDSTNYNLRNANNFRLQRFNRTATQNSVLYKGLQIFNDMPNEIKIENNFAKFVKLIEIYIKEKY